MRFAGSRHAPAALAVNAFAESAFFPIPPDALLAPMVLARPERAWTYAAICTAGSVVGGLLGWLIGYALAPAAQWLLAALGHPDAREVFVRAFARHGVWVILIQGLLPIPYKLVTIASGLAHFNPALLAGASLVTRGARFFGVTALLKTFGPAMLPVIERRLALIAVIAIALIAVVVVALRFLR